MLKATLLSNTVQGDQPQRTENEGDTVGRVWYQEWVEPLLKKGREGDKIMIDSGMNKRLKRNEVDVEDLTVAPCRLAHSY